MFDSIFSALDTDASHLIASVLVCFYAWSRFNTPISVRSQTSRFQFLSSGLAYVASCEGLMLLMAWVMKQQPSMLSILHVGGEGQLAQNVSGAEAPLVAALMLTTLLPSFPLFRDLDAKMLGFFHDMGEIPFNAVRWSQRLEDMPFAVSDAALAEVTNYVHANAHLPDTLTGEFVTDPKADRIRWTFTRVTRLYVGYMSLETRPRFANAFPKDTADFENTMASFFAHCVGYFATARQLAEQGLQPESPTSTDIRKVILESDSAMRVMLARVLLYSCNNEAAMAERLRKLGFSVPRSTHVSLPVNLLCLDLIGVLVLFTGATYLSSGELGVGKAMAIGLLVAVNHVLAATFAVLPKQLWGFADIRRANERPVLAYLISSFCAFTVSVPLSYGFYLLRLHVSLGGPILPFAAQCKWLLLSTILAFALAFECDDHLREFATPKWLRWVEGAGLAALLALTGVLVMQWLAPDQLQLHPFDPPPKLWLPVALSAGIGALFGATIPHWYRGSVRKVGTEPPFATPPSAQTVTLSSGR